MTAKRMRSIVFATLLSAGPALVSSAPALANGGGEAEPTTSLSPLVLIPAGLAALAVGYVVYRIFRGRSS